MTTHYQQTFVRQMEETHRQMKPTSFEFIIRTGVLQCGSVNCVSGERLAAAIVSRRSELWDSNPRLAERIEMRIKDAQRAHRQAHGGELEARECLVQQHLDGAPGEPD
jgi:hypothetical protein